MNAGGLYQRIIEKGQDYLAFLHGCRLLNFRGPGAGQARA